MSQFHNDYRKVAFAYMSRQAALEAIRSGETIRTASAGQVRKELSVGLASFGYGYDFHQRGASIKGLARKLKDIWKAFQQAPNLWQEFKSKLGLASASFLQLAKELPKKLQSVFDQGQKILAKAGKAILNKFPFLQTFFEVSNNLPSFTSLMKKVKEKLPEKVRAVLDGVASKAMPLAQFLDRVVAKHPILKALAWPAKAYLFWKIWINVTEISWNIVSIAKGMLGLISWVELFESLPESGMGFVFAILFPFLPSAMILKSVEIGLNILLPMALALQVYWLRKHRLWEKAVGSI